MEGCSMLASQGMSSSQCDRGSVLSLQDFFQKDCWAHHPKPYQEYMDWRKKADEEYEAERNKLIPGM